MDLHLHFSNQTKAALSEALLFEIATKTLEHRGLSFLKNKEISIGARAVTDESIQALNKEFRNKDAVTDILSFGEYATLEEAKAATEAEMDLGELIFAPAFILKAAEEDQVSFEHELAYIFSHGVLHLLGFDHSDQMFAIQDAVTAELMQKKK